MGAPAYAHPAMLASERPVRLAAFGELLWDVYPKARLLGGAPANVAFHADAAGAEAMLISRVGADALGHQACVQLAAAGVDVSLVGRDPDHPTGSVTVTLGPDGPSYAIEQGAAWDFILPSPEITAALAQVDVFCFGSLAQRSAVSRNTLRKLVTLLHASQARPLLVFDLNLRPPFVELDLVLESIAMAQLIKLNDDELSWLQTTLGFADGVRWLLEQGPSKHVALTRGAEGATIITATERIDCAGFESSGSDPVGAGDAFTATLAVEIARSTPLDRALRRACERGAWVAGKAGAMPAQD